MQKLHYYQTLPEISLSDVADGRLEALGVEVLELHASLPDRLLVLGDESLLMSRGKARFTYFCCSSEELPPTRIIDALERAFDVEVICEHDDRIWQGQGSKEDLEDFYFEMERQLAILAAQDFPRLIERVRDHFQRHPHSRELSAVPELDESDWALLETTPRELEQFLGEVREAEERAKGRGKYVYSVGEPPGRLSMEDILGGAVFSRRN